MDAATRTRYINGFLTSGYLKDGIIVGTTIAIFALFAYVYLYLKPTVVLPPRDWVTPCPNRWSYDPDTDYCTPQYSTPCKSFMSSSYTDPEQRCDIAKACGTSWKGMCS